MEKKHAILAALALVAALAVVNATVFAYRTLYGQVKVTDATSNQDENTIIQFGAACAGFYINDGETQDTIGDDGLLPTAGTNNQATIANPSNGWYGVKVELGEKACEWTNTTSSKTNTLYASATVYINVTQGKWLFKDILGFGYPKGFQPSPIYVTPVVSTPLDDSDITNARLILYDANTNSKVLEIDLKTGTVISGSTPLTLSDGQGYRINIELEASGTVNLDKFTIDFYVSTMPETP
jgi:hypothetical protein